MKPQDSPLWKPFQRYARHHGISFEHEDDWIAIWEHWSNGIIYGLQYAVRRNNMEGSYALLRCEHIIKKHKGEKK